MSTQGLDIGLRGGIPDLHDVVVAGGGEGAAIRAVRHPKDAGRMPAEGPQVFSRGGIPDLHHVVVADGGEGLAVRAVRHAVDAVGVPA